MSRPSHHEEIKIRVRGSSSDFAVRIPTTDIDGCIHVSPLIVLFTAVSIALAVTDIPRTGLTFSAQDHSQKVGPGVAIYFGPYDYHVGHLHDESDVSRREFVNISGSCEGEAIETLDLWSYKQDTLSIAPRAVTMLLNVTAYPPCVLYKEWCPSTTLELSTVFMMLDSLVDAIHGQLFASDIDGSLPFEMATMSYWIDRLHHYLVLTFAPITDIRFHEVYHWSSTHQSSSSLDPRKLCAGDANTIAVKPAFCHDSILWECAHPTNSTDDQMLPIWDHIAVRFEALQAQYTELHDGLQLDFTMFISTMAEQSKSSMRALPSVTILTDALEITTLIRGRECDVDGDCRTVFIDDYRYERGVIESDEANKALYVTLLRGLSQLYIWLRVALLVWGCYAARSREPKHRTRTLSQKLAATWTTVMKVPGHVIMYGSWLPLVGYAMAHFFDSGLVQSLGEFEWSSLNGFFTFNVVDYVLAASIQMRNIWLIVLVWKAVFWIRSRPNDGESMSSHLMHRGVTTLRGGWVGVVSWLTTFSMMRALSFRNTDVLGIFVLSRHTAASTLHTQRNLNDYGLQFDAKCSLAAFLFIVGLGGLVQAVVGHSTRQKSSIFVCQSFYVPYSAGTLWSWSALDIFWPVQFRSDTTGPRMDVVPAASSTPPIGAGPPSFLASVVAGISSASHPCTPNCRICHYRPSIVHWPGAQGCPIHEPIYDIHARTKTLWSVVRLMNIANMTDPVAFFRLYVTGRLLYLYRVTSSNQPPYTILLPTAMDRNDVTKKTREMSIRWQISHPEWCTGSGATFELLHIVDSRDIPWQALVNCG